MFKKKLPNLKYISGYSLVEILVVLSIMSLVFGAGYANYRGFSRRQALTNFVKNVQADLRFAQSLAIVGQIPTDASCNGNNYLNGYYFNVLSSTRYEIRASCSGGGVSNSKKTVTTPAGITITSPFPVPNPILFKVLGSGTNIPSGGTSTIRFRQSITGGTAIVTVSAGGQIQ